MNQNMYVNILENVIFHQKPRISGVKPERPQPNEKSLVHVIKTQT